MTAELFDKLQSWMETGVGMLPNLALALMVVCAGWFLARAAQGGSRRMLGRASMNPQVTHLLTLVVRTGVLVASIFVALGVMDLDKTVTSLLAGVGVVGLALGFAFQDIAANFMAGVLLAFRRPFREGDIIETNGFTGTVEEVDLRSTRLRRFGGDLVILPNKDVFGEPIVNVTETEHRRVEVECGVSYDEDLEQVRRVAIAAVEDVPHRFTDRPIELYYTAFGGSSVDFVLRFWICADQKPFMEARSEAIVKIKRAFDAAGVDIPFPIRTLRLGAGVGEELVELREAS